MLRHWLCVRSLFIFFFFNDTATTEIYTLSLHDALPIYSRDECAGSVSCSLTPRSPRARLPPPLRAAAPSRCGSPRSEEHTSELQSQSNLVCRLLLEKKKYNQQQHDNNLL